MNKNLYKVIAETLDILCYFNGLRATYSSNTRHTLQYITDMEKLHCQSHPTYCDWRMLLENLEEKANAILYEAERDIITAILFDAKNECEAEFSKKENP